MPRPKWFARLLAVAAVLTLVAWGAPVAPPTAVPPAAKTASAPPLAKTEPVGSTSAPTAAPAVSVSSLAVPALDPAWTVYDQPAEGFSIALPPSWKQVEMAPGTLDAVLHLVAEQNPPAGTMLNGQIRGLVASDVKFFGFDTTPDPAALGFSTNINVLRQPVAPGTSLSFYTQTNLSQLESLTNVVGPITHRHVSLPAAEAEEIHYRLKAPASGAQTPTVAISQFLIVVGRNVFVITFTTTPDQVLSYDPIFEQIGRSFRVI